MSDHSVKKPLLIYDGDCRFCRQWVARWSLKTQEQVAYESYQEVGRRYPEIPKKEFERAVQLLLPDGQRLSGAEAIFRALSFVQGASWPLWAYQNIPGMAALCECIYGLIARHRVFFSQLTRWLWGDSLEPSTYYFSRWLFLRLLGVIYLIAFISLGTQVLGLVGQEGIVPAASYLETVSQQLGNSRYWQFPTIFWISAEDNFLRLICWLGALLSLFLIFGIIPAPAAFLLWFFYLSLTRICGIFTGYQWDALLLETGFLAMFFAPLKLWPDIRREAPPPMAIVWLLRWLLFRLMFSSGLVKLLSGDETWRNFTALQFHYETQPLPTILAWLAHQLPAIFQKACVGAMFFIELAVPFLVFLPRRPRFLAGGVIVFFMALIAATGNYCFFNLLTVALCLVLLDDAHLSRFAPKRLMQSVDFTIQRISQPWAQKCVVRLVVLFILLLSGTQMGGMLFGLRRSLPGFLAWAAPFEIVNNYGLFAVMTTARHEIVLEGSKDGKTWVEYEFKWKPGDLKRRPLFVAPHQPRLDWQMWFAVLGTYQTNPWFINFMVRLLQGSPQVLGLLAKNPFPEKPRYVRALVYDYHFTDWRERRRQGTWWRRELLGLHCPIIALKA